MTKCSISVATSYGKLLNTTKAAVVPCMNRKLPKSIAPPHDGAALSLQPRYSPPQIYLGQM